MKSARLAKSKTVVSFLLTFGLLSAACGSDESNTSTTGDTSAETPDQTSDEMDEMAMNMGDPNATPASDVEGAEVSSGMFELLETRPEGYDEVTGTADLARSDAGTTVTIQLVGLEPNTDYISHVHEGPCSANGGDHYKFDPAGSDVPPNEIHLAFTSDADGAAVMHAVNEMTAGPEAITVVVYPVDLLDNKIACATLS